MIHYIYNNEPTESSFSTAKKTHKQNQRNQHKKLWKKIYLNTKYNHLFYLENNTKLNTTIKIIIKTIKLNNKKVIHLLKDIIKKNYKVNKINRKINLNLNFYI